MRPPPGKSCSFRALHTKCVTALAPLFSRCLHSACPPRCTSCMPPTPQPAMFLSWNPQHLQQSRHRTESCTYFSHVPVTPGPCLPRPRLPGRVPNKASTVSDSKCFRKIGHRPLRSHSKSKTQMQSVCQLRVYCAALQGELNDETAGIYYVIAGWLPNIWSENLVKMELSPNLLQK